MMLSTVNHTPRLQLGNAPLTGFDGGTDQIEIIWQTDSSSTDFSADYRLVGAGSWISAGAISSDNVASGRHNKSVTITGLSYGTEYEYRVIHGGTTYRDIFDTRLAPGDPTAFSFVTYGDSAGSGTLGNFRDVQDRINTHDRANRAIAFTLSAGDQAYDSGTHSEYDNRFNASTNPELTEYNADHIEFYSMGNHEDLSGGGATRDNYSVPIPVLGVTSPAPPDSQTDEESYSFDYGNVHFATFNSDRGHNNDAFDVGELDDQLDWLEADLAASSATWKIAWVHHPLGGSPDKDEVPGDNYWDEVIGRLRPVGLDVFIAGHSHTFHRSFPLTGSSGSSATFVNDTDNDYEKGAGLVQVVTGTGGRSLRSGSFPNFIAEGRSTSTGGLEDGFTRVDVTPTQLTFRYIHDDNGAVEDTFTITNTNPTTPPSPPTIVSPTSGATNVSINGDISWNAGAEATSHDVYFGTDSTPDAGEFIGNQAGTTYDPGTLNSSTTYYWQIVERNDFGTAAGPVWSFTIEAAVVLDANFDSGSIGPYTITGNVIDLALKTDQLTNNSDDYTYWANFKLSNVLNDAITLNFTGIDAVPFLAHQGPEENQMVYSCDGATWNRFTQHAYSPANSGTYTITETFLCNEVQIATFFPFSYQRMQDFIDSVSLSEWATQETLGSSLQGRDVDLLTITNTAVPASSKTHIYIVVRHHAAETSSSHMLNGLIDFMISGDSDAQTMRDNFVWHIVPMMNPDGVFEGNSRATSELRDPNRDWGNNETDAVNIVRSHLASIDSTFGVDMFIDWHSQMNDLRWSNFVYSPPGNSFFSLLSQWTDFDEQEAVGTSCPASSCTSRGYATLTLGLFTFVLEPTPHLFTWTKDSLKQQGINTTYAITEYFGVSLDSDPPTPDPMTWATLPNATGSSSVSMTASTASDPSGVEYFFTNTTIGGHDSGWQDTPTYVDTGLQPNTSYTYTVMARDKSTNQNVTATSTAESATTDAQTGPVAVTLLDPWVVDGSYATQNATFNVSSGANRIVVVGLSAEKNQNGPIEVTSVSLGNQVLTEVFDFTVGSPTAYHNLHWFGYLLESEIQATSSSGLITISYANAPSNPFDEPKIHYASYQNVDQTIPIADSGSNTNTSTSSLQLNSALTAGAGDKIVGFNVAGQHYAPGISTPGYTEVTEFVGATNGHASGAYERTATTAVTENPTFTVATGTRIAVSAVVLNAAAAVVDNDPPTVVINTGSTVAGGGTDPITSTELRYDDQQPAISVAYTVTTVTVNGQLELTSDSGVAITSFTQADIDTGLLVYVHDGSNTTSDAFTFDVNDGQGNSLIGESFGLIVTAVDDDPPAQVANTGSTVVEGGIDPILVGELRYDDTEQGPAAVAYAVTGVPANGQLELTSDSGVAITIFTQADIDAGLLEYVHDGSNTTSDGFTFDVNDGQGNSLVGESFGLIVTAVDDDPPVQVANTGSTVVEGGIDPITIAELRYDDTEQVPTAVVYVVTGVPTNGQLELTSDSGTAITSFTQADIDTGLLEYVHDGSNTTSDAFTFDVNDGQGNSLVGESFDLIVTAVDDDPPVQVANTGSTVVEGGIDPITIAELRYNDTEQGPTAVVYTVTGVPTNGQLELTSDSGVAITSFTQADIDTGLLVYVHDGSNTTSDVFTFDVNDGQGNSLIGESFAIAVTAVGPLAVTLLDGWVVDGSYANQDATFDVSPGTNRIVIVALSAEKNGSGPMEVTSVSLGGQVLTEVFDFTVGSPTAYHNLHWVGYLLESQITAGPASITVSYANAPSNPFDEPKIHYASYQNVDQTTPIADSGFNSSTSASSLQLSGTVSAGFGDQIIGFNVAGQHYALDSSYAEVTESIGATNGHASAAYHRTETTSVTENPTFTVATATRMAVSAIVLNSATEFVDNAAPVLLVNAGSTVARGGTDPITSAELRYDDAHQPAANVTYTVITEPNNGQLELNSVGLITSFTQSDIDDGLLVYVHGGSDTISDGFTFVVDDGQGNSTAAASFAITVTVAAPLPVTLLDAWVVDGSYAAQDAAFDVSPGTNRIVVVALSAEKNGSGPMEVTSVSLGGQVLTEVFDFTVGSSTAYHNLHWVGYLLESQITAGPASIAISYANAPSNPFDEPKIHYASYENVDQITPIVDSGFNTSTSASSLQLSSELTAGDGDKIVGFNVAGQHYAPGISTPGYTEVTEFVGATNGHASAVYHRTATTSVTENPTFTVATGTRMAVSAVVLNAAGSALHIPNDVAAGAVVGDVLTHAMLGRVVEEAVAQWAAMGVDPNRLDALSRIDVRIDDLPDSLLGLAYSNSIVIDRDAAGYGWARPSSFAASLQVGARGVDLLSAVTHEFGHILGFDHDVMGVTLPVGVRNLDYLDEM